MFWPDALSASILPNMVTLGLDIFLRDTDKFRNRNIALICNHTSVNKDMMYSWDLFVKRGLKLKRIFAPEHGLFGTEQDQVPVAGNRDLPFDITSLYGDSFNSLIPDKDILKGIDTVIFDIQDVGSRYYTYLNTMILFMRSISGMDIQFIVLDRPNPICGDQVEGPVLDAGYESFVGLLPVCVRHGLTACEVAAMARNIFNVDIDLKLITMQGWRREMFFDETGLTWVPPSPNMPALNTALVYPGCCLFEGTNLSEGRGTTTPFEIIGADFIDPYKISEYLNDSGLKGAYFRPVFYKPTFNKFSLQPIGGIFIHVTDRRLFRSFDTAVSVLCSVRDLAGKLEFIKGVYEFNDTHHAFDLLCGNSNIRRAIENGVSREEILAMWSEDEEGCRVRKMEYHLYE